MKSLLLILLLSNMCGMMAVSEPNRKVARRRRHFVSQDSRVGVSHYRAAQKLRTLLRKRARDEKAERRGLL